MTDYNFAPGNHTERRLDHGRVRRTLRRLGLRGWERRDDLWISPREAAALVEKYGIKRQPAPIFPEEWGRNKLALLAELAPPNIKGEPENAILPVEGERGDEWQVLASRSGWNEWGCYGICPTRAIAAKIASELLADGHDASIVPQSEVGTFNNKELAEKYGVLTLNPTPEGEAE